MRRKQGLFPYVKPHSPFVNTKPSTWKDYVASSTGKTICLPLKQLTTFLLRVSREQGVKGMIFTCWVFIYINYTEHLENLWDTQSYI